jgi:hypothetical protein
MLTIKALRDSVSRHGIAAINYASQDIREALEMCRQFEGQGIAYDRKRASEYADELAIVAQVRQETVGKVACPCCGKIK